MLNWLYSKQLKTIMISLIESCILSVTFHVIDLHGIIIYNSCFQYALAGLTPFIMLYEQKHKAQLFFLTLLISVADLDPYQLAFRIQIHIMVGKHNGTEIR